MAELKRVADPRPAPARRYPWEAGATSIAGERLGSARPGPGATGGPDLGLCRQPAPALEASEGKEEAFVARLIRRTRDPDIIALTEARAGLTYLINPPEAAFEREAAAAQRQAVEPLEVKLAARSRAFRQAQQESGWAAVQAQLPAAPGECEPCGEVPDLGSGARRQYGIVHNVARRGCDNSWRAGALWSHEER